MVKVRNNVCVDVLYVPSKKGFNFYIIDRSLKEPMTYVYFLSEKLVYSHNFRLQDIVDLARDYCFRNGIEYGMVFLENYLSGE